MTFQVKAIYEENVVSKKTGNTYSRVVIDFGKFKKFILLGSLESEALKNLLESTNKSSE